MKFKLTTKDTKNTKVYGDKPQASGCHFASNRHAEIFNLNLFFFVSFVFFVVILLGSAGPAFAAGTAANTVISSTATADYSIGGVPGVASDSAEFTVQEILDVNVVWEDATMVPVLSPSTARVLRFRVTNTGNGVEQFLLAADGVLGGDNFNPVPGSVRVYVDDGDEIFSPGPDIEYTGPADVPLPADGSVMIFVVADIPSGLTEGAFANVSLTATSEIGAGQLPGAVLAGAGDGGVDAIVIGASAAATGAYRVEPVDVSILKSVEVIDTLGGTDPHPGATLRYTLQVNVGGVSVVNNLVITDVIPANTTYTPGSITLDGVPQTDADDAPGVDFTDFNVTAPNTITVDLGQAGAIGITPPATFTIVFEVTIN